MSYLCSALLMPALVSGVLELPVSRRQHQSLYNSGAGNGDHSPMEKRTIGTNMFNVLTWSFAGVTAGSPPQPQTVILGTGASDLYFSGSGATDCQLDAAYSDRACRGGTFDISRSNTFKQVAPSPAFNIVFGDGSNATGPFGTDIIGIGNAAISGVQFAVADAGLSTTGNTVGLLGLGYYNNEAVNSSADYYPTVVDTMVEAGVTNSGLYSVYLGSTAATSGSILFGAIDITKYIDPLVTLNLLPGNYSGRIQDTLSQLLTTITAAEATVRSTPFDLWSGGSDGISAYNATDAALPVLLDTGSTAWTLPNDYFNKYIVPAFRYVNFTTGLCSCDYATSRDTVKLTFGGKVTIEYDASEFIVPYIDSTTGLPVPLDSQNDACVFLINNATTNSTTKSSYSILGDGFLKNMYAVFDLDNGQVSLAQAVLDPKEDPIVIPVAAGEDGLAKAAPSVITASRNSFRPPTAVPATLQHTVSTLATPIGTAIGIAAVPVAAQAQLSTIATPPAGTSKPRGGSGTGSAGSAQTSAPPGPHSNTGAIAGGVVGGVVGLALIGALIFFLLKRKKSKPNRPVSGPDSYEVQQPPPEMQNYMNQNAMPPRYSDMEWAAPKPPRGAFQENFTNDGRHEMSGLR